MPVHESQPAYAGAVIARLLESRLLRWGFVLVALVLCGVALSRSWDDIRLAATEISWPLVAGAQVAVIVGIGLTVMGWRRLLADLGSPLPVGASVRIVSLSQLGKYVPGSIWPFVAQVELGHRHGVPRRRSATVSVLVVLISLVTALLVAAVTLPFGASGTARTYLWGLAAAPVLAALLHPAILNRVLDWLLRVTRRPPLERRLSLVGVLGCAGWSAASWLVIGAHVWLLARGFGASGSELYLTATGAFALAWSIGFVIVVAPAGAGVREVVLVAALSSVLDPGKVLLLVIISRVVMTIGDLFWAGAGLVLGRAHASTQADLNREAEAARELARQHRSPSDRAVD